MANRRVLSCLAIVALSAARALAQDVDDLKNGIVKIRVQTGGSPTNGHRL
jgi:hypothetical protein